MKSQEELISLYLNILKKAVLHDLYKEDFYIVRKCYNSNKRKSIIKNIILELLKKNGFG